MASILKQYIAKSGELVFKEPSLTKDFLIERQKGLVRKILEIMPQTYTEIKAMLEEAIT